MKSRNAWVALGGVMKPSAALRRAVTLDPKHAPAWQRLGHQLAVAGDEEGSRQAFQRHFELSTRHPELIEAIRLMRDGKLGKAERIVRDLLKKYPADVSAIKMLADIGFKMGRLTDARPSAGALPGAGAGFSCGKTRLRNGPDAPAEAGGCVG